MGRGGGGGAFLGHSPPPRHPRRNRQHWGRLFLPSKDPLCDLEEIAQPIYPKTVSVPGEQVRSAERGSIKELSSAVGSVMRINSWSLHPEPPPAAK